MPIRRERKPFVKTGNWWSTRSPRGPMLRGMYTDQDKWRELGRSAGARIEAMPPVLRFSRKLLVVSALCLIAAGVFGWL